MGSIPGESLTVLEYVLGMWSKEMPQFEGSYDIRLCVACWAKLFHESATAPLQGISVPGDWYEFCSYLLDLIYLWHHFAQCCPVSSISSKPEKWSRVPLRVKIVQIMIGEFYAAANDSDEDVDDPFGLEV